uniref:RNA-directed DNA polymerase n=1 Tax=Serinus canaria TaxID=9135 RepID=A0A8C9N3Y6_SERCA
MPATVFAIDGCGSRKDVLPVQREDFDWSFANSVSLQSALENFSGQITYHLPSHKLLHVARFTQMSLRPKNSQEPVQGPTVFTDGSGRTGKAIVTWKDGSEWQVLEGHEDGSAQLVELRAAVMAFEKFSQEPFNLVTDSAYVADIAQRLGHSVLKEVSNPALFHLLKTLWRAIQARVHPFYVLHVRSHTSLPGFIVEGNARADKLASPAWVAPQPDTLAQAKASHGFFHQNAHTLQKQFQLTPTEARDIVESCDDCHALAPPLPAGVNPRGLRALELWQTDVTQIAEFGRLKYVHVTVDTFSAMWASAHTGEKARDVIAHWRQAFAVLGVPSAVKTDNGPAYASQKVRQFLQLWGVSHKFGIPHSPTGQAIVERAHGTLKRVLQKQKRGMQGETPHSRLAKALYTINHLTVPQNSNNPVILNHHLSLQAADEALQPRAKVRVQNLVTKQWEGPYDLIALGRGYACVSTDTGVRWVPSKCVRPDLRPQRQNPADGQHGDRDQPERHQTGDSSSDDSDADDASDRSDDSSANGH